MPPLGLLPFNVFFFFSFFLIIVLNCILINKYHSSLVVNNTRFLKSPQSILGIPFSGQFDLCWVVCNIYLQIACSALWICMLIKNQQGFCKYLLFPVGNLLLLICMNPPVFEQVKFVKLLATKVYLGFTTISGLQLHDMSRQSPYRFLRYCLMYLGFKLSHCH